MAHDLGINSGLCIDKVIFNALVNSFETSVI